MAFDPLDVIVEILGEPAATMRSPVNAGYNCPFINSTCVKQSHRITGPYPLCTIAQGQRNPERTCVCPKRFYAIDLVSDIINNCWPWEPPSNSLCKAQSGYTIPRLFILAVISRVKEWQSLG